MRPMQAPRLYLKDGVDAAQAITILTARADAGKGLSGETVRHGTTVAANAGYLERRRDGYIDWADASAIQLTNVTNDTDVLALPYTPAYWEIRQLIPTSPRGLPLIDAEIARQAKNLEDLRGDLELRLNRVAGAHGHIVIVDTNVLLHHQLPDSVNWPKVVGHPDVRVVIPLRVIEELDAMKYTEREATRSRARERLPKIHRMVGAGGLPNRLNEHTTVEVFIEPGPRTRPADADTEILETAHELRRLSGHDVTIVTGDTGMRLRAEGEGIATVAMA
jgi:rRNA-processing protein FCF1